MFNKNKLPSEGLQKTDKKKRSINNSMGVLALLIVLFVWYAVSAYMKESSITKSTHSRSELDTNAIYFVENDSMYNDEGLSEYAGDYISYVEEALETFYTQTGVQPYLYIVPEEEKLESQSEVDALAGNLNNGEVIKDNAHFLVVYQDNYSEGAEEAGYYVTLKVGEDAASVMDDEACSIFSDYLNKYYYGSEYTSETLFNGVFKSASSKIMSGSNTLATVLLIVIVILLVGVFVVRYRLLKRNEGNL